MAPWWCVNEGAEVLVNELAFESAKSATNDCSLPLTKSSSKIDFFAKIKTFWRSGGTSRIKYRLAVNCYKMRSVLKSSQNSHTLFQYTIIQPLILNAPRECQSEIFENSIKLKYNTKLTLETMNKLKLTLEMQLAKDPSNFIDVVVEYQLPLAGTRP